MAEFARERLRVRGEIVSPMFDPQVNAFGANRAFWMRALDENRQTVMLQAYRVDFIDTNLADWSLTWMLGLYHKRSEPVVPTYIRPPPGSQTEQVTGQVVYFGEAWVHPDRRRESPAGHLFALRDDLVAAQVASQRHLGLHVRSPFKDAAIPCGGGYPIIEPNVYRWQWGTGRGLQERMAHAGEALGTWKSSLTRFCRERTGTPHSKLFSSSAV